MHGNSGAYLARMPRLGNAVLRQPDRVVPVRVQEGVQVIGGGLDVGEQSHVVEPVVGQCLAVDREVVERGQDVRCRRVVGLGEPGQPADVRIELRQLRVDFLQPGVERDQRLAEFGAAALQALRDRGQGQRQLVRLDGLEHGQQVVQHLLEFERVGGPVLPDHASGGERFWCWPGREDQVHIALAEQGGRQHFGGDVGWQIVKLARVHGEQQPRAGAVRAYLPDLADLDAAHHHLGARVHLVADAAGVDGHQRGRAELLVVQPERQPDQQAAGDEEDHARCSLACLGPAAGPADRVGMAHPAIRTVVVAPQIARLMKKSMMLIATIAVRTARPTATPTPAGPPSAR